MKTPIILDAEHMAHVKMLLSYRKDIPEDYARALVAEVERCREALEKIRDHEECILTESDAWSKGVVYGHRCAAAIAEEALKESKP